MADVYCSERDLYDHGIPRGSVPNPGKLAASALASTDAITLTEHGFEADDPVSFRGQGASAVLPAPLVAGVTYYVVPLATASDYAFRVAAAPAGPAIDLTSNGDNVLVLIPLPKAKAIEWASRVLDDMLPAHVVPLVAPTVDLVPPIVRMTCAELAAWKLSSRTGPVSKSLAEIFKEAQKRIDRWATGVPVRGDNAPPAANLATSATAAIKDADGWAKFGGIL